MPSKSEAQRGLFGAAYGYKKGTSKNVSGKAKELARTLSSKTLKEFTVKVKKK
jgi:hypothetical protein